MFALVFLHITKVIYSYLVFVSFLTFSTVLSVESFPTNKAFLSRWEQQVGLFSVCFYYFAVSLVRSNLNLCLALLAFFITTGIDQNCNQCHDDGNVGGETRVIVGECKQRPGWGFKALVGVLVIRERKGSPLLSTPGFPLLTSSWSL